MPDPDDQPLFAARDRLMRREAAALTPDERLARMDVLERECFERLSQSPEGFDRFWRRNLRKRAVPHYDPSAPA